MMGERQEIRVRLEWLAAQNGGRLTPEIVVADAKSVDSPLHGEFEWNVDKAAYQHWLDQARALIRSVRVVVKTETMQVSTVAYVRDPNSESDQQGYVSIQSLRGDRDAARAALIAEFSRAASYLRRAREIAAALSLSDEVDQLLEGVVGLRKRVEEMPAQMS